MSTESETKSTGVPAGATHPKLIAREDGVDYFAVANELCDRLFHAVLGMEIVDEVQAILRKHFVPPRPAQTQALVQTYQADAPEHLTISSAFGTAQPQAPAEPSKEQIEKAQWIANGHAIGEDRQRRLRVEIAAALAAEAAPLREERDRLAEQLVGMTGERNDERKISQEWEEKAEAAEKAVAERDARIEKLAGALGEATVHALRVGEALRELIRIVSSDGDEPRRMRPAVGKAVKEGLAALSAPPPPPREQELLGKEGATDETWIEAAADRLLDTEEKLNEWKMWMNSPRTAPIADMRAMAKAMDDLQRECRDLRKAAPPAPPRKAPQEGPDDARAEEFRLGWNAGWLAGREAAAQEAGVRFGTAAEDALFALAAPSSPEEQLSGKELK